MLSKLSQELEAHAVEIGLASNESGKQRKGDGAAEGLVEMRQCRPVLWARCNYSGWGVIMHAPDLLVGEQAIHLIQLCEQFASRLIRLSLRDLWRWADCSSKPPNGRSI